jgi:hypothetical protein
MSTATQTFQKGDRVTFPPESLVKEHLKGVTFIVIETPRENPRIRNLRIQQEGGGPRYSVRPTELIPATASEGTPPASAPSSRSSSSTGPGRDHLQRPAQGHRDRGAVRRPQGRGTPNVNIAKLGGAGGQAWRWPRAALVKRDVAWLTERLVEVA